MTSSLKQLKPESQRKVLLYGDSGAGKTIYGGTFPGPIYFFDFDNKISSLVAFGKQRPELQKKIDADEIDYDVYAPVLGKPGDGGKRMNAKLEELHKQFEAGKCKYKTIVFDSMTTMVDEVIRYLIAQNPGIKRGDTKVVTIPALQDYLMNQIFLIDLITTILKFPCNVLFTAHIERVKDKTTGELSYAPMFPGKLATKLPIYFEEVHRAYVNDAGVHCCQTKIDKKYTVIRSQIPKLPPEMALHYNQLIKER